MLRKRLFELLFEGVGVHLPIARQSMPRRRCTHVRLLNREKGCSALKMQGIQNVCIIGCLGRKRGEAGKVEAGQVRKGFIQCAKEFALQTVGLKTH